MIPIEIFDITILNNWSWYVMIFVTSYFIICHKLLQSELKKIHHKDESDKLQFASTMNIIDNLKNCIKKQNIHIKNITFRLKTYKECCLSRKENINLQARMELAENKKLVLEAEDIIKKISDKNEKLNKNLLQKDKEYVEVLDKLNKVQRIVEVYDRSAKKITFLKKLLKENDEDSSSEENNSADSDYEEEVE